MTMTIPAVTEKPRRYTVKMNGEVIGKAELRRVPVSVIKIDHDYQREAKSSWVATHYPFNEQLAGVVVLSSRSGGPYCMDGGHRIALARASGVEFVNAFVIDGLSKQQEASLFTQYQRERTNLTAVALYRADLVSADPETLGMTNVIQRSGFQLPRDGKNRGDYTITAIDSVRYIYRQGGAQLLAEVLELVKDELWVGLDKALSGPVLKGIALFLQAPAQSGKFDRQRLSKTMRETGPQKLLLKSQDIAMRRRAASTSAANVAEAPLELYNKPLPPDRQLPALTIGSRRRPVARGRGAA